jgi:hypothetical protein
LLKIEDSEIRSAILRSLDLIRSKSKSSLDLIRQSDCSQDQKSSLNVAVELLLFICTECVLSLHEDNCLAEPGAVTLKQELLELKQTLGESRCRTQRLTLQYKLGEKYQFCPDVDLAQKILEIVEQIGNLIDDTLEQIESSHAPENVLSEYRDRWASLHTAKTTVGLMVFLDHPDLIPNDDWKETVDYNRRIIDAQLRHSLEES